MIFVTVGTERFPFDRLVRKIDQAVGEGRINKPVFIQKGHSSYTPEYAEYRDFLKFSEMVEMIRRSQIVVSHAGVGSFLLCLQLGKIPIIVPRRASLGEHLDDHQMEFAKCLEVLDRALVAYSEKEIIRMIDQFPRLVARMRSQGFSGLDRLTSYIKELIEKGAETGMP